MVETVDVDCLRDELSVSLLDHVHNLLLDKVEILSVASRSAADDVVDLDIIFLLAEASTVHGIGEFDEDRVLLHDPLDMLTTDANDTLVVLIRHVERDGSRHLLLDQVESVFSGLVLCTTNYNVKVVLVEAIEHDLHAAVAHNLVDLAVLLAADEFFVLVCKLNLDTHVVLRLLHEWDVANHHQSSSHGIVRSIDMKVELLEADFSARIDANVREHGTDIGCGGRTLRRIRMSDEPRSTVELPSLFVVSIGDSASRSCNLQEPSIRAQCARRAGHLCPGREQRLAGHQEEEAKCTSRWSQ